MPQNIGMHSDGSQKDDYRQKIKRDMEEIRKEIKKSEKEFVKDIRSIDSQLLSWIAKSYREGKLEKAEVDELLKMIKESNKHPLLKRRKDDDKE